MFIAALMSLLKVPGADAHGISPLAFAYAFSIAPFGGQEKERKKERLNREGEKKFFVSN